MRNEMSYYYVPNDIAIDSHWLSEIFVMRYFSLCHFLVLLMAQNNFGLCKIFYIHGNPY